MMLSIIIPAHNEEENIADIIEKVKSALDFPFELVVVNDHSCDNTANIVEKLAEKYKNIKLVENKFERGFANAIKTGFLNAGGDLILPLMADLCDDLATVPLMITKVRDGFDIVCGSRYVKGGARLGGSKIKAMLSRFGGVSLHYLLGIPTCDIPNAFKMYKKKVIDSVDIQACGFEISMEIALKAFYAGFKISEVPTLWKERTKGKSSFKVFKLLPSYVRLYVWALYRRMKG
jgi:glycosyltransferase involved in cell wall biosynthesis